MKKLSFDKLLIFTNSIEKYFFTEFSDSVNIIYGRNTSGKSTLLQLILYCLGINEDKIKLAQLLAEGITCRVDLKINKEPIQFVRKDDTIYIRQSERPITVFTGINSNNSAEHIKLKDFIHSLFDFDLELETKYGLKSAPIETIFLPYYISQSVGCVNLRNFGQVII